MIYPDARVLLRKYGLQAKKSWGQNFLVDERVFQAIVRAAGAGPDDTVVEIGAALGTLTARLALAGGRVIAVERDRDMVEILRAELAGNERVVIAEQNALTYDYAGALGDGERASGRRLIVVGNLPYQIASQILFRVLEARGLVARMVVMLQLEMAQRIVAKADSEHYGALSVMVQMAGEAKIVAKASGGCFHPPPRVDSAVLTIDPLAKGRVDVVDEAYFSRVVHAAFGQRRKTLRNALKGLGEAEAVERGLVAAGIDGQRRGETLDVAEFARLSDALLRTTASP